MHKVLSIANFKLYLNGIAPYVLLCSLFSMAQHCLLRGRHHLLVAIVHLFHCHTVLHSAHVPGFRRFPVLGVWLVSEALLLKECCLELLTDNPWSSQAPGLPFDPGRGTRTRGGECTSVSGDNARLLHRSRTWHFLSILPKRDFVRL